jgi:hypothetical protein
MSAKAKYNYHGWAIGYDSALGMKEVAPMFPPIYQYDDFLNVVGTDMSSSPAWTCTVNGGTAAIEALSNGSLILTQSGVDDASCEVAGSLSWYGAQSCCMEVRVASGGGATHCALVAGFVDTNGKAGAVTPWTAATATYANVSQDGPVFIWDTDLTAAVLCYNSAKANTMKYATTTLGGTTASTWTAGVYKYLRIMNVYNGSTVDTYFFEDGVLVGTIADSCTPTTALAPIVSVGARSGAADHCHIDYIKVWQKRA